MFFVSLEVISEAKFPLSERSGCLGVIFLSPFKRERRRWDEQNNNTTLITRYKYTSSDHLSFFLSSLYYLLLDNLQTQSYTFAPNLLALISDFTIAKFKTSTCGCTYLPHSQFDSK